MMTLLYKEIRLAAQITRKVSFRKGARGDFRSGTMGHSFSTQRFVQSSPSVKSGKAMTRKLLAHRRLSAASLHL